LCNAKWFTVVLFVLELSHWPVKLRTYRENLVTITQ